MNIYSDIVKHSEFGNLYVTWSQKPTDTALSLVTDTDRFAVNSTAGTVTNMPSKYILNYIRFTPSHMDIMTAPGVLADCMPTVYEFLVNFPTNTRRIEIDIALLDISHCTKFTADIYKALLKTDIGTTITYGELARVAGYPNAHRAVGSAMRKNRLPFIIPCHRVVASNGIGGYTSNRVDMKERLIEMEYDFIHQANI